MLNLLDARQDEKGELEAEATLGSVLDMIAADHSLPPRRRADICSGVRSLCRALGMQLESTPADPRHIADRLAGVTPAGARMAKRRFQNCKSHLDAALAYAKVLAHRRRNADIIDPAYQDLLKRIPDRWLRNRLARFCRFASNMSIAPEDVDDSAFDAFLQALENSTVRNFRTVDRNARKIWNDVVRSMPDPPYKLVSVPSYVDHYVLPAEAFPASLWSDVDRYLESRRDKGATDLDELLTEAELLDEADVAERKHIRDSTSKLLRYRVRQFASALVIEKLMMADEIGALVILVAPKTVSDGLRFFIRRAGGERHNSQIHGIATDLLTIAKRWVKSPESDLKKLASICSKVKPQMEGLPESARRSLTPFKDFENVRAFLRLPERIVADVERRKNPGTIEANRVAAALWIKIAQRAPLRISNLLGTDLDANILRSHNGKNATVALYYPADKVKNSKALEVPLSRSTTKLLELYLTKYRKLLVAVPSPWLFPASNGGHKRSNGMSSLIQRLMMDYLGFAMNPHSFRHVAAKLYLSAHPGRYVDVQLLLGHKQLETTIKYYCELEAEEVFKHFDSVLLRLEHPAERGEARR